MKIAEFEKRTGLSRDTLRYYEKIGVLSKPSRGLNGYREYGQTQFEELAFLQKGKSIGFSLSEIRTGFLNYKKSGKLCAEFTRQLNEKKDMLVQRIEDDKRVIAEIEEMLR